MRFSLRSTPWIVVVAALAIGSPLVAQEGEGEMDPAMQAMIAAGTPGEHHEHMAFLEGAWDVSAKFWMPGSSEPMTSGGQASFQWVLGGRYLHQAYRGEFMGMPFEGFGVTGYDNIAGRHVATWIDSISTAIMSETGQCEDGGRTIVWHGEMPDPATGTTMQTRTVETRDSDDRFVMTSFMTAPDGGELKTMELVYTREK